MPVVTRSRSKRAKKDSGIASGFEQTPRRSARLAAKRTREESSDEGRQTSMTPSHTPSVVKNPGQEPKFSGITLGRFQLGSKPNRVPTFNENKQSWDFEPESEVPQLARNLTLFIITVTLVVLAVIYKEQLFALYDQYMPASVSDTFTNLSDSVQNAWTNVVDAVTNALPSQNDNVTTETIGTDGESVDTSAADITDSATDTVTDA